MKENDGEENEGEDGENKGQKNIPRKWRACLDYSDGWTAVRTTYIYILTKINCNSFLSNCSCLY